MYTANSPATLPTAIGVGSIANAVFPLVYSATDSAGKQIKYASIYPLNFTNGADVSRTLDQFTLFDIVLMLRRFTYWITVVTLTAGLQHLQRLGLRTSTTQSLPFSLIRPAQQLELAVGPVRCSAQSPS